MFEEGKTNVFVTNSRKHHLLSKFWSDLLFKTGAQIIVSYSCTNFLCVISNEEETGDL
jgi:hypothetical protein